jgi:hypothetical protein
MSARSPAIQNKKFVIFLSVTRGMLGLDLEIGHNHLILYPYLLIYYNFTISHLQLKQRSRGIKLTVKIVKNNAIPYFLPPVKNWISN